MTTLRFGCLSADLEQARRWIENYVDESNAYAFPSYDMLVTGSGPDELNDGDLMAHHLLVACRGTTVAIGAMRTLQSHRPPLEAALSDIRPDADLLAANDEDWHAIRTLYDLLPHKRREKVAQWPNVGVIRLSKVLHRKRPTILPLYDDRIQHCYFTGDGAPCAIDPARTWGGFMVALAQAMRKDLMSNRDDWLELASMTDGLTPLRALDIVAWSALNS